MTTYAIDTNVLIRLIVSADARHAIAQNAIRQFADRGDDVVIFPQSLYELWVVSTRPVSVNGYGQSTVEADRWVNKSLALGTLLAETSAYFPKWLDLVRTHGVSGKPAHDARLVAGMIVHNVSHILTFNTSDFARYPVTAVSPAAV